MANRTLTRPLAGLPALPIDRYRGIAAVLLIGMLLIAALAPLATPVASPAAIQEPPFDGQIPLTLADAIFNYPAESERQAIQPAPMPAILRVPPGSTEALSAIGGAMIIEDNDPQGPARTPSNPHLASDGVQPGGPARWDSMEQFFLTASDAWAANGLGIIETLRAAQSEGSDREQHLRKALYALNIAVAGGALSAPYDYNRALLHLVLGHYQQAATMLAAIVGNTIGAPQSELETNTEAARFYEGVALLRLGEPGAALALWRTAAQGSAWSDAIAEGIADALAASGDGGDARIAYRQLQDKSQGLDWGIYEKQVRLELTQGGVDSALRLIDGLVNRFPNEAQMRYDQGRLLLMESRSGPAATAFRAALNLNADDPAYHTGLAQALLAGGDARRAQSESEAAIRAVGLDPAAGDLSLTYGKLDNSSAYQRAVGQIVLDANLMRAQALAAQGQQDSVAGLAARVEGQGAGGDAAKSAWFRYYAGLLYAAGGLKDQALQHFKPAGTASPAPAGPPPGAPLLAWVRSLTPAEARDQAGVIAQAAGGQPGTPAPAPDSATATAYYELARKLEDGSAAPDAGPYYRAAAAWEAAGAAGLRQPPLGANGSERPVEFRLTEADYLRRQGGTDSLAATRYQQVIGAEPALAAAYVNRGIVYYQAGDTTSAQQAFEQAQHADPNNAIAGHNLGVLALNRGPAGLISALPDLSTARVAGGPATLRWDNGILVAPDLAGTNAATTAVGFGVRLPALITLLLLLLHTLIPTRRPAGATDGGSGPGPEAGFLSRWGEQLAGRVRGPEGSRANLLAVILAAIVGGLGWAWAQANNVPLIALALLPLTILAALLAVGVQEGGHWLAVRREREAGMVQTRLWPLGLLLSLVGAPFGLLYGWLVTTRAQGAAALPVATAHDGVEDGGDRLMTVAAPAGVAAGGRRATTVAERRATEPARSRTAPARRSADAAPAGEDRPLWRGWAALGPEARAALAGLAANVLLALVFGVLYGLYGSPLWRVGLLGALAVLAFTAVSDRDADGWQIWRRSPLLWLILFAAAAAALATLLLGAW